MGLAIVEAKLGAFNVSPNPPVGCVVLDAQRRLLAKGHHQKFGGPHAEVNALQGLKPEQLRGALVYVTLEPCAHEGKTPSCAKMLAQLPLARVCFGLMDPNPLVCGQGAKMLEAAGIVTDQYQGELLSELEEVCEAFLWNHRQGKIFVNLKMAASLDGVVALQSGESRWITNEAARNHGHYLRACSDAVMVGAGTIAYDNPQLTIRLQAMVAPPIATKKIVVLDTYGKQLKRYRELALSQNHQRANVIWCVSEAVDLPEWLSLEGPQVVRIRSGIQGLDLIHTMQELWRLGLRSILVEGGPTLASALLESGLVNRISLFTAPIILGTQGGKTWTSTLHTRAMDQRQKLYSVCYKAFGDNWLTTGRLK